MHAFKVNFVKMVYKQKRKTAKIDCNYYCDFMGVLYRDYNSNLNIFRK